MLLRERLEKNGAWLFRWRSYLPLALIVVIIPAFKNFHYPFDSHTFHRIWVIFCFAISLVGLLIRCYTNGHTPKGTSGRNTKSQIAKSLNTSGIYSVTRNPLYLGNFFMMLGATIFLRVWWISLIYALSFWLYYERIIMTEEVFLTEKFGEKYESYVRHTSVFFPNFKLWQPPILPFLIRSVLKREYSTFFALVVVFTALVIAGDICVQRHIVFDPVWVAIFTFGLLTYATLRTLKKKTRLLDIDRR
jgi:protein-S-isoprenylcysteine O-methyltransferase Ste14